MLGWFIRILLSSMRSTHSLISVLTYILKLVRKLRNTSLIHSLSGGNQNIIINLDDKYSIPSIVQAFVVFALIQLH
jgi:hypothetical protein